MNQVNKDKIKRQKHFMTPIDALCVIERLLKAVPNATMDHVAFAIGISRGHLSKETTHLLNVVKGEPDACAKYNTRRSFMRHLFLLDNSTDLTIKFIMQDAINYGGNGNIASTRGRRKESDQIIGVTTAELEKIQAEIDYLEADDIQSSQLKLLCRKKDKNGSVDVEQIPHQHSSKEQLPTNKNHGHSKQYLTFCSKKGFAPNLVSSQKAYRVFKAEIMQLLQSNPNVKILEITRQD